MPAWIPNALLRPVGEHQGAIDATATLVIDELERRLGAGASVYHVGSTALPPLLSRGIVDVLVRVPRDKLSAARSTLAAALPDLTTPCPWEWHLEAQEDPSEVMRNHTMLATDLVTLGEYRALQRAHAHRPGRAYPNAKRAFFANFSDSALTPIFEPHRLHMNTERLELVSPLGRDAEEYAAYLEENRESFRRLNVESRPLSAAEWREQFAGELSSRIRREALTLLVRTPAPSSELIGSIHAYDVVLGPYLYCHFGYNLAEAWQGKGLMSEAVAATLKLLHEHWGLRRVMATYLPKNTKSASLLQRLGFSVLGTLPEHRADRGGFEDFVLVGRSLGRE